MNTFASSSCTRYHFISDARRLRRFADIIVEYVVFIWMNGPEINSKCSTTEFLTHHSAVESYCIAEYPTRGPSKNVTCGQSYHIVVDIPIFEDWLKRYYRYWKVMQDTREMSVFQFYYLTKRWGKKNSVTFRFVGDPEHKTYMIYLSPEGSEKRPRRLSNADLISSSRITSDLFNSKLPMLKCGRRNTIKIE